MRKVVVYTLVSLDGVAEAPETFIDAWDDVADAHLAALISTQDTVLLGRRSYDEWAAYWPSSQHEPFATFINGVTKYVATSTPLEGVWHDAHAIDGDVTDVLRELATQEGGDIGVHASIALAQSLLSASVVDELVLLVAPAIVGEGRRLLDGVVGVRLRTTSCVTTPSGHLLVHYDVLHD